MGDNPLYRWASRNVEREVKKDTMPRSERFGQVIGVGVAIVFLLYFAALYNESTGFFTPEFTAVGAFMFFGAGAFGIVPTLIRFVTGRKNPARPADAVGNVLMMVASVYLLAVFPLDFAHLGDLLPHALESVVEVITNDIARILLAIGAVISPVLAFNNILTYFAVREELSAGHAATADPQPPTQGP